MPNFTFKGRKRGGDEITGTRSADSAQDLAVALRQDNIMLIEAKEKKGFSLSELEFGGAPTPKDVSIFTKQFSVMIDSGLPMKVVGDPVFYEPLAVAVDKGDDELVARIASVVEAMQADGTLSDLSIKWYGVDLTSAKMM